MTIDPIIPKSFNFSEKEKKEILELEKLVPELNSRKIPEELGKEINRRISFLNGFEGSKKPYLQILKRSKKDIFELLQKKLGLVPQNYYTTMWMPLGMSVFGLPLGASIMAIAKNSAFIGLGLQIGLALGSFYGKKLDKKAAREHKVMKLS